MHSTASLSDGWAAGLQIQPEQVRKLLFNEPLANFLEWRLSEAALSEAAL